MENAEDVLSCDGFESWADVDRAKSTQYGVEHEELATGPTKSCWIASTADKVRGVLPNEPAVSLNPFVAFLPRLPYILRK